MQENRVVPRLIALAVAFAAGAGIALPGERLVCEVALGLRRRVDDVRVAVGSADHRAEVERLGALGRVECVQVGGGDRDHAIEPVEASGDLGPERREDGRADLRRRRDLARSRLRRRVADGAAWFA